MGKCLLNILVERKKCFSTICLHQDVNASKIFSEEAAQIYERAISGPLRKNQLLFFAYADFEESRLRYQEVHKIYQRYIEMEDVDPTLVGPLFTYLSFKLQFFFLKVPVFCT